MTTEINTITVKILNKEIKVQCPHEKVKELQESAVYLEEKMIELAGGKKGFNVELIAIVTALNMVRELMAVKRQDKTCLHDVIHRLRELKNKIEQEVANR